MNLTQCVDDPPISALECHVQPCGFVLTINVTTRRSVPDTDVLPSHFHSTRSFHSCCVLLLMLQFKSLCFCVGIDEKFRVPNPFVWSRPPRNLPLDIRRHPHVPPRFINSPGFGAIYIYYTACGVLITTHDIQHKLCVATHLGWRS